MRKDLWSRIRPYVMVAPAMAGIALFVLYPIGYLIYISLHKYNLMNRAKSTFIGFDHYQAMFSREDFHKALSNTFVYTASVVALTISIALALAVWLSRKSKFNSFVQAAIFTPHVVSIVSIALIWLWLMEPNLGFFNYVLKSLGLPPSRWLQSSGTAMMSIVMVSVWGAIGYYVLIIVAAIQSIPASLYEAAALDNASKWKVLTKITLPIISPQLFFILVVMTIGSFKVFDTVQVMTGGGPNNATNTLVYYIYTFRTSNLGYSAATGVVLMAFIGLLTVLYFRLLAKRVHYQ